MKKMEFLRLKIFKIFEIVIIFIGLPLLYYFDYIPFHKSIPLLFVFTLFLILLLLNKELNKQLFGLNGFNNWRFIFLRFLIISGLFVAGVSIFLPGSLFMLPNERPGLWILIMLLYPLWSVYPQELIYRTWFFQRYKNLINSERILIILNAALFSFSHIIFRHWLAIFLSFFGGLMFAYTYRRSGSLMVVFIEHMLYGNMIFTVGLGQYFYLSMDQ